MKKMPLYDILCEACKTTCEWYIRKSDLDEEGNFKHFECPYCNKSEGYTKLISSGTNFQLYGGGWAKDLYSSTKTDKKDNKK